MIGKRVAVKMLRPDLGTDPGLVSRFFQEAKAVNEIRHPNIVDISDFGHTEDGIVYFVMELMEGQSLRDRISASGPMPIDLAVTFARQVIDALAAAHRVGIVHRDLKPDNIFLVADAQVPGGFRAKLFDFGVAKLLGDKQNQVGHKTIDGAVVGTPFYMSPEQALCQDVGTAADIYAMGVVMYEMVTGTVPFRSEQLVLLLNAILKQPAPPPSRSRRETPPWLDRLVLRCLEKDPEARPRSMEEVNAILTAGSAAMSGGEAALGATMMAPVGLTPPPVAVGHAPSARTAVARQPTLAGESAATVAPQGRASSATGLPKQTAARGGAARPSEAMGLITQVRAYLDTRRVQRVAIPLIVVVAVGIVASIFVSAAAKRPIAEIAPEVAPPPLPQNSYAVIHINSEPPGAEVVRLNDNRALGTTPVEDIRPADKGQISYNFHMAGYTDVQMLIESATPGPHPLSATLAPVGRRSNSGGRAASGAGHRAGHGHDKKHAELAAPAAAPATRAVPAAAQASDTSSPSGLPPLGERNPVKRLGH
jgi:serine/threonine-protein kinase